MRYQILHESPDRLHLALTRGRLETKEADILYYALAERPEVLRVQVFPRTGHVIVRLRRNAGDLRAFLDTLSLSDPGEVKLPGVSARATNEHYREKIIDMLLLRGLKRFVLPLPLRTVMTVIDAAPFILHGVKDVLHRNFSAEIVHASAISASLLIGDFPTASSITFLTELGEVLEEWTYKKSVDDLAQSLALNVSRVWRVTEGLPDVLVNIEDISAGDRIRVTMGNVIPLDGVVAEGEAMVNQAALTGEPLTVRKITDRSVFAGTVVEEGELVIEVKGVSGQTRYDKIIRMIQESESMSPVTQSRAEQVVRRLIPWTFGTAVVTWLLTRNVTKAASVLMVDFSCAIEVAMPVATLSAMSETSRHRLTVKGGKFLETIAAADTIVFDKTGTLTRATPCVEQVVAMGDRDPEEMLRIAACLEEHFPHSLANAVVRAARERGLNHDEMHSKAEYIVARGIASSIGSERVIIGSHTFVFEDEGVPLTPEDQARMETIPPENSHLFLAIGGKLAAVIGIADPVKPEAVEVIRALKDMGIRHVVMMTGDSERTARAVAERAGITEFYAEVLPEDKAHFVEEQKALGRTVIMVGDGINDSPALSAADVGIAMKEGADIAREIADVTLSGAELKRLITLKQISDRLMPRMHNTARVGIGFNAAILLAGLLGLVAPGSAAFLHNASTIGLSLYNMTDLVPEEN